MPPDRAVAYVELGVACLGGGVDLPVAEAGAEVGVNLVGIRTLGDSAARRVTQGGVGLVGRREVGADAHPGKDVLTMPTHDPVALDWGQAELRTPGIGVGADLAVAVAAREGSVDGADVGAAGEGAAEGHGGHLDGSTAAC